MTPLAVDGDISAKPGALIRFGAEANVFEVGVDGSLAVREERVAEIVHERGLPMMTPYYTEFVPNLRRLTELFDEEVMLAMRRRDQTVVPLVDPATGELDGRKLTRRPSWKKDKVDDGILSQAQDRLRADGYPVSIVRRTRTLQLDPDVMEAFGITEEKLAQYADKVSETWDHESVTVLKEAAKIGGVGGEMVKMAIMPEAGSERVYVNGKKLVRFGEPEYDLGGSDD